jgi:hypothetical protein
LINSCGGFDVHKIQEKYRKERKMTTYIKRRNQEEGEGNGK